MRLTKTLPLLLGVALLFGAPFVAQADDKEKESKAGGSAAEHRSEKAAERSNAQWSEGATKGPERAGEVKDAEAGKPDVGAAPEKAKTKKAKPAKKAKKD